VSEPVSAGPVPGDCLVVFLPALVFDLFVGLAEVRDRLAVVFLVVFFDAASRRATLRSSRSTSRLDTKPARAIWLLISDRMASMNSERFTLEKSSAVLTSDEAWSFLTSPDLTMSRTICSARFRVSSATPEVNNASRLNSSITTSSSHRAPPKRTYTRTVLSLIPISDANPTRRFPIVTVALIVANVIAFFQTPGLGQGVRGNLYFFRHAPIPCQLGDECPAGIQAGLGQAISIPQRGMGSFLLAVLFSTFLHAGFLHIIGNMLFLWVFGNNVEDYLGRVKFLIFYLAGGMIAAFAHILFALWTSPCPPDATSCVPSVGASGAVAAVMGAYILLYPRARVNVLVPIFFIFTFIQMSALAVLGIWFLYQFFIGVGQSDAVSGVAWMAHVGGFVFGVVAVFLLGGRPHRPHALQYQPQWRY
jgi:membrane associated rhomboid family serine protease